MNYTFHRTAVAPSLRFLANDSSRPPLLMLHGVVRGALDFETIFDLLEPRWRVVALDQRGHGGSARAASYLVTDYIADAVRFVREELAGPVVIHGHSLGAMVAAAVAAALPERVGAVILEDPPFHAMGRHIHESLWQAQFLGMREVARRGGSFEAIADGLAEIPLPFPGGVTRRLGEFRDRASLLWSAECISQMDPEVLTPVVEGRWLAGYDELEIARRIRCPVRLLQGDLSAGGALSDREAELFASAVPACRIEKFPGIGHLPHWFAPERVAAIINEFAEPTK